MRELSPPKVVREEAVRGRLVMLLLCNRLLRLFSTVIDWDEPGLLYAVSSKLTVTDPEAIEVTVRSFILIPAVCTTLFRKDR